MHKTLIALLALIITGALFAGCNGDDADATDVTDTQSVSDDD